MRRRAMWESGWAARRPAAVGMAVSALRAWERTDDLSAFRLPPKIERVARCLAHTRAPDSRPDRARGRDASDDAVTA